MKLDGSIGISEKNEEHPAYPLRFVDFVFSHSLSKASVDTRLNIEKATQSVAPFAFIRGPEGIRTPSLLIRSQVLYPVELRDLVCDFEGCKYTKKKSIKRSANSVIPALFMPAFAGIR
jgi:hypothetical protein